MLRGLLGVISLPLIFAAFSSSSSYQLNSYGLGPGGSSNSSSSTYHLQASVGEQADGTPSSSTYISKNGSIGAEQIAVPGAPTLDNGSGTYYNKLKITLNTSNNPSDATYSIAASTNGFVSTSYVQADGTLGASAVYQTYTAWGGASGSFMVNLVSSTTYQVKVDAMQGLFTNTAYGVAASGSTVAPSLTFSMSPNSTSFSSLLPNTITTGSNDITLSLTTNAVSGGGVYVSGQSSGLRSILEAHTIGAFSGNLTSTSEGFGIQAINPSQTSGGPFVSASPFNVSGNSIGAETTVPQQVVASAVPVVGGSVTARLKAKASSTTPAGPDYQEILTFIAAASF